MLDYTLNLLDSVLDLSDYARMSNFLINSCIV